MSSTPDDKRPSSPHGHGRSGIGRGIAVVLAIIPMIVIAPLAATARALHELWADDKTRNIVTAAGWLLVAGTVVFMIVEDLSLIDGFYFSFITLATIGYGDIAPATDLGKIIAVLYGISGLGVMASLVAAIARRPRSERRERRERRAASGEGATG